jgi:hypothetical protein
MLVGIGTPSRAPTVPKYRQSEQTLSNYSPDPDGARLICGQLLARSAPVHRQRPVQRRRFAPAGSRSGQDTMWSS